MWRAFADAEMADAHDVPADARWAAGLVAASAARLLRTLYRPEPSEGAVRVWAEGLATNARTAGVTPPLALVLIAEGAPIADAVEAAELLEAA